MTDTRRGVSWRPDPELKAVVEAFAKNTNRSMSQAVTTLVTAALSGDVSYGPATAINAHFQKLLDARHTQFVDERHKAQNAGTEYPPDLQGDQ